MSDGSKLATPHHSDLESRERRSGAFDQADSRYDIQYSTGSVHRLFLFHSICHVTGANVTVV
jgi:hypothetical protein